MAAPATSLPLARRPFLGALAALGLVRAAAPAEADDGRFLRIATGSVNGTYYPVGELIARVISSPPGARPCDPGGGACGVPDLIVVVQTSKGSVENVAAVEEGRVESGFAQSDIAHGAYTGSGIFAGRPPMTGLRALASLYLESVHLVARSGSGIRSVGDLRGRRVALDVEGSGTLVEAELILDAFGLSPGSIDPVHEPLGRSLDLMAAGELDALFLVAGYPATAVSELARDSDAVLVPIEGAPVERLLREHRFFTPDAIPQDLSPYQPGCMTSSGEQQLPPPGSFPPDIWNTCPGLDPLGNPNAVNNLTEASQPSAPSGDPYTDGERTSGILLPQEHLDSPVGAGLPFESSYSVTFPNPGTYTYHCAIHPGMTGTVVVIPKPQAF